MNVNLEQSIKKYYEPAELYKEEKVYDDFNNPTKGYVKHSDIQCRIRPLRSTEDYSGDKINAVVTHRAYMENINIEASDLIKQDEKEYRVISISNVMHFDILLQVELEEIQ